MTLDEVTKEDIQEWSDEEVRMWFQKFQEDDATEKMREALLKAVDIRDAKQKTIKVHSKVLD